MSCSERRFAWAGSVIFLVLLLSGCCTSLKTSVRDHGEVMQEEAETLEELIERCKAGSEAMCDEALRKAQAMQVSAGELADIAAE